MHQTDPVEAKRMAKHLHSPKWDVVKKWIMFSLDKRKFKQNRPVQQFLMSTEKKDIVQLVPHSFWGIGNFFYS
uniref:NADAR domain-containing protein n=1 Tax=Romanomermis culicivorax TaxID=13658 RepID=A0A915L573_ROMCU